MNKHENRPLRRVLQLPELVQVLRRRQVPQEGQGMPQTVSQVKEDSALGKAVEAARRDLMTLLKPKP